MRITIIEPDGEGGLFHFAYQLCDALAVQGHSVCLISSSNPEIAANHRGFSLIPAMRLWSRTEVAVPAHTLPFHRRMARHARRARRGVMLTIAWVKAVRLARSLGSDAIVVSMILHHHILVLLALLVGRDAVLAQICHEFVDPEQRASVSAKGLSGWSTRAYAMLTARIDRIFFLSEATRRDFLGVVPFPAQRSTKISHGSQAFFTDRPIGPETLRDQLGISAARPVLLFFGILRPSKGIEDLIDAFAVAESRKTGHLLIAGRATGFMDVDALRRRIDMLGLRDRVTLVNAYIPGDLVGTYFEMARAVALPYRSASASGVLHTAYSFGRAVVVTAVGGLQEDVLDGRTGLVVPPGDTAALAAAIDRVMIDAALASALGASGKLYSESHHTWSSAARTIADALAMDLDGKRRAAAVERQRADA